MGEDKSGCIREGYILHGYIHRDTITSIWLRSKYITNQTGCILTDTSPRMYPVLEDTSTVGGDTSRMDKLNLMDTSIVSSHQRARADDC